MDQGGLIGMLKKLLIGVVLLGLLVNIGLSFEIKTDKETYYCIMGVCDPVKITVIPDKIDLYKIVITWETEKGDILTSALSTDLKTTLTTSNFITYDKLALTTATTSFIWKFSATGSGKFNISAYNSLGKLVYNLDPTFKEWVVNASAVYQNYTTGNIWDLTDQALINYFNVSGVVPIQARGLVSDTSIGNFTNTYYYRDGLSLWNHDESFSITMWVQRNGTGAGAGNIYFLSSATGLTLDVSFVGSQNKIRWQTSGCDTLASAPAMVWSADNAWTLLTFIYDSVNSECLSYYNTSLSGNVTVAGENADRITTLNIGVSADRSGGDLVDFFINQIVFWNKTLSGSDIAWFYNTGLGQEPEEPADDFLIITHQTPENLTITSNPVNISMIPTSSSLNITDCSLYINGTLNNTINTITNNTLVSWILSFANGSYAFNYTCTGETRSNSTTELNLSVVVAYPPALSGTDIPLPYGDPTRQICLDNITLYVEYTETIAYGGAETTFNRSKSIFCNWGCSSNACNPAPFDNYLNMFKVFLLILAGLIGILFIGKKKF